MFNFDAVSLSGEIHNASDNQPTPAKEPLRRTSQMEYVPRTKKKKSWIGIRDVNGHTCKSCSCSSSCVDSGFCVGPAKAAKKFEINLAAVCPQLPAVRNPAVFSL